MMKPELKKIAEDMYNPTQSLFNFLTMCDVASGKGSVFQLGGALKDDELLALIDWWKKQKVEKEYYLVINPDVLKTYGFNSPEYVNYIEDVSDRFVFHYGAPSEYSETELETIKQAHPTLAPAIDAMKVPVEEDK